jgi:acetamidase/formamidase
VIHEIPLERRTLHGHFSRDLPPILTIDPGDTVAFACPNANWEIAPHQQFLPRNDEFDAGHALIGPIEVRGAKAGGTLAVRIDSVRPGSFGFTTGHQVWIDWELADGVGVDERGARVELAPFLGVLGMPPKRHGRHSTGPPRRWGGNIDCKELVAGTTLYLPISVDGAHFSAGDGHAAQGDGEASGTAIECPVERAELTIDLADLNLRSPIARTPDAWIAFGFNKNLDLAAEEALATMLDLMERELGIERPYALALASVAVDVRVTQIVNWVKGAHAVLRDHAIRM